MLQARTPRHSHGARLWLVVLALTLLGTAACGGSALSPQEVKAANDAVSGSGSGTGTSADDAAGTGTTAAGTGDGSTGGTGTGSAGTGTGSSGTGGAGTGSTGTTAAGSTGTHGAGTTGTTSQSGPATDGVKAASCAGFKNGPGMTDSTITIGNSSDISGPVPGLFQSAQDAVKAYIAYFNSSSSICGRKLQLVTEDSRTDAGADQQAYQTLCSSTFAAVGSMSAFDDGGAATAQGCGLPDLRTAITTSERAACTTCFASQGSNAAYYENAPFTYFMKTDRTATQHAALLYLNAAGAAQNGAEVEKVAQKLGMPFKYVAGIGTAEFNYGPYVQNLKSKGIQYVFFIGPYQDTVTLQQAMAQASYQPKVFLQDPTIYDPGYVQSAGSDGNGSYVYMNFLPFSLASTNKEESTYLAWLHQVAPSANPTFYGVFAWSAAALFVQEALELGGKLTRASLVDALRGVNDWTDHGMTAPQNVGGKVNGSCWRIIRLENGAWQNTAGYQCDGVTHG